MTPSRSGRITSMLSGARPYISRASRPRATIFDSAVAMATTVGSWRTISPFSQTSVFTVPRSIPSCFENSAIGGLAAPIAVVASGQVRASAGYFDAQVGPAQRGLGRQVGFRVARHPGAQRFFGALAGLFGPRNINLVGALGGIGQHGD